MSTPLMMVRSTRDPSRKLKRFDLPDRRSLSKEGTSTTANYACTARRSMRVSTSNPLQLMCRLERCRRHKAL